MPGDKKVVVSPNLGNETVTKNVVSDKDLQMYFFTLTNTLKNYKLFKTNQYLYRNNYACDRCYQLYSVNEARYVHKNEDITVCDQCMEDLKDYEEFYDKYQNQVNGLTGLKWA